ncbi:MAG TPA: ankyrin repeat domain-containing protein [Casimicrobiaceae bacterium]|jgi:ankyrin repeat protein|nr:ankyrin repeat domain-containing protein [Casimicrobiaceae bacterium]
MRIERVLRALAAVAVLGMGSLAHAALLDDFLAAVANDRGTDVRAMLARGVDPDSVDANGDPAIVIAARGGNLSAVNALIAARVKVDAPNRYGDTALMVAALGNRLDVAKALRAAGANVNPRGWTPLAYAATGGHDAMAAWLIGQGANLDAPSANGTTPLMMAAREGRYDTALLLIAKGANVNARNENNLSALDFARRNHDERLAERLQAAGAR